MCGRTALTLTKDQVRCACSYKERNSFKYTKPEYVTEHNNGKEYAPSYNIAPTDITPVLISNSKFRNSVKTSRILKPMMWGIIPPWHKGDYKNHKLSTNNCRLENLRSSKLYNPILNEGGRCVIIVEGFYEWQTTMKTKQPYYIYKPQVAPVKVSDPSTWQTNFNETEGWRGIKLLTIAGLYHAWQSNDTIIYSYSVITMESNETMSWLHHRMPAILDNDEKLEAWLDIDNVGADIALGLLRPTKILEWHPVSKMVNNSNNKSMECNKAIVLDSKSKPSQTVLTTWFTKSNKRKSHEENDEATKKPKLE